MLNFNLSYLANFLVNCISIHNFPTYFWSRHFHLQIDQDSPAGGTGESEGNQLIPEGVIFRNGLCPNQGPEACILRQVIDLACVSPHILILDKVLLELHVEQN